jgi:hypothetical protein
MLTLAISGIDIKTFALSTSFLEDNKNVIITLDANKTENIIFIDSHLPINLKEYKYFLETAKEEIKGLFNRFKKVLIRKLI